jgi:cellulose synthase/poly-beta-1,6-N-acetylglucosamine synthase-like glycosyltransferase
MLPESFSAKTLLSRSQLFCLISCILLILAALVIYPNAVLSLVVFIYILSSLFRALVLFSTKGDEPYEPNQPLQTYPKVTILLPVYKEAALLKKLFLRISKIDYPNYNAIILLEEDDLETIAAANANILPFIKIIIIPNSLPKTKPKACNYGLSHADGEYITIFDAEDIPGPSQIRQAMALFAKSDGRLACVQARLRFYNHNENMLTQMFDIEYANLFDSLLPFSARHDLPILLGGTSNYIRKEALLDLGAWDSYNVTEDADLGLRLKLFGYEIKTISSYTREEACVNLHQWLRQRARWIKGHIITFIVMARHSRAFIRTQGLTSWLYAVYILLISSLTYALSPYILLASIYFINLGAIHNTLHFAMAISLGLGIGVNILSSLRFAPKVWLSLLYPFYFLLHIAASQVAIYKLLTCPHVWDKTEHNLTKITPVDD